MSSTSEHRNPNIESLVKELEDFCGSSALSLDGLLKIVEKISPIHLSSGAVLRSSFLQQACLNKNVALEMVQFLLDAFPGAASITATATAHTYEYESDDFTSYSLHCACYNDSCPSAVIELLMKSNPSAIGHMCLVGDGVDCGGYEETWVEGLPLHYYLGRESNIDINTVKMLVHAQPEALTTADALFAPMHILASKANISSLCDVARFLVETEASCLTMSTVWNATPLHVAFSNGNVDIKMAQLLLDFCPDLICQRNDFGENPLHALCMKEYLNETASLEICVLLVNKHPELVTLPDDGGYLPLHHAVRYKSPRFFTALINAYPEALRIGTDGAGNLPIHGACSRGNTGTVKCAECMSKSEVLSFLLQQYPAAVSKATTNCHYLPLHLACDYRKPDLNSVRVLFDAYPEAIFAHDDEGRTALDIAREMVLQYQNPCNSRVVDFLEVQLVHARNSQDMNTMQTLDSKCWRPLHHALHNNASLGAIKLLVRGNPSALRVIDYDARLPLHIACEFSTPGVVQYLVELSERSLDHCASYKNSPLHFACCGGNCGVVKYLLERHVSSVSRRNGDNKLPIQLLVESGNNGMNSESPDYLETVWRLLLAYLETLLN